VKHRQRHLRNKSNVVPSVCKKKLVIEKCEEEITLSSKTAMPIPLAAPEPASPMKCPLPMLLANSDAPTYIRPRTTDTDSLNSQRQSAMSDHVAVLNKNTGTMDETIFNLNRLSNADRTDNVDTRRSPADNFMGHPLHLSLTDSSLSCARKKMYHFIQIILTSKANLCFTDG